MAREAPTHALEFLRIGQIRPQGWLRDQLQQDLDGYVGNFPTICEQASRDVFVTGRVAGGDNRHWWDGEAEGKWIDGLTRLAHVLADPQARARVENYLHRLIETQDTDGYLGIYQHSWRAARNPCPGDLWTQTFLLLALLSHHEATGDDAFLTAAHRGALATIEQHGPGGPDHPFTGSAQDSMVLAHNVLIVEPMLWLYDLTGDQQLLAFAQFCYESYSAAELGWPESDGQLTRISDPALPFLGHGAHTCAQLRVPLLLYYATGEARYQHAYEVGFTKITDCLGISGACKSDESIGTPDAPGAPLPGSGYEYCAITELLHSLHLAMACTGDLAYAERAERLALNAAQASRQHDGHAVAYFGADNQIVATKTAGARWDYSPTHDDIAVCCTPSAARFLPHHVSRAVLRTPDDGLLVAFYGPWQATTAVQDVEVTLTASTHYPFDDTIEFEITAASPVRFPLRLRVPSWCASMTIAADNDITTRRDGDTYLVDTDWFNHTIRVDFDTHIRTVEAIDHTAAVERGPLVYALDIPAQVQYTRDYPVAGYHDIDYTPTAGAGWDHALLLDADRPTQAQLVRTPTPPGQFPWTHPPIRISVTALNPTTSTEDYYTPMTQDLTLIPIGATTLRRTCFPHIDRHASLARSTVENYPMRESTP